MKPRVTQSTGAFAVSPGERIMLGHFMDGEETMDKQREFYHDGMRAFLYFWNGQPLPRELWNYICLADDDFCQTPFFCVSKVERDRLRPCGRNPRYAFL